MSPTWSTTCLAIVLLGIGPPAALVAPITGVSQRQSAQGSTAPIGRWTGTSTCLVRPSPCKDEHVVYYLERTGDDSAATTPERLTANKVVNGREESMGDLTCRFTHATSSLLCPMPPQYQPGEWRFTLHGAALTGGLWMADGTKFRSVQVRYDADQRPKPA